MSRISKIGEHIVVNLDSQTIFNDKEQIYSFTSGTQLFSLLEYFCKNPNLVLTYEMIHPIVYGDEYIYGDKRLKSLVNRLRGIISRKEYPDFANSIQTKSGGYMYTGSKIIETCNIEVDDGDSSCQPLDLSSNHNSKDAEACPDVEATGTVVDVRSDSEVIANNLGKGLNTLAGALKAQSHDIAEIIRNNELFNAFRNDYDRILKYCISKDPSAEPISICLHDDIDELQEKWKFDVRKVTDIEKRNIMQDVMSTFKEYKYYISDVYMRVISNSDRLIYKNSSIEESERLRNELRPRTVELRRKMDELYKRMWPEPDLVQTDSSNETATVESFDNDSAMESEEPKTSIVHQTVVNQYGDHPVHIDYVDNLNL